MLILAFFIHNYLLDRIIRCYQQIHNIVSVTEDINYLHVVAPHRTFFFEHATLFDNLSIIT